MFLSLQCILTLLQQESVIKTIKTFIVSWVTQVPEQDQYIKDNLLCIHNQRETIQVLSTEQENVFQN